jgi:hypothetical protein
VKVLGSGHFRPDKSSIFTEQIGGWMSSRASLEVLEKIKFPSFYGEAKYDSSVVPDLFSITLHLAANQPLGEADQKTPFD